MRREIRMSAWAGGAARNALISVSDMAKANGVTVGRVYKWCASGRLPAGSPQIDRNLKLSRRGVLGFGRVRNRLYWRVDVLQQWLQMQAEIAR